MKKILYSALIMAFAAFTLTSCEDVPMPYSWPGTSTDDGTSSSGAKSLPYTSTSCNDWTAVTVTGIAWSLGSSYAKASGYSSETYTETEAWLVSPLINTTADAVIIDFDQVIRYVYSSSIEDNHKLFISDDYDDDVTTATWTELAYTPVASSTNDWTFYAANTIQVPDDYLNKDIRVAFRYTCSSSEASTWEVQSFVMKEGTGGSSDTGNSDVETTGDGTLENPYTASDALAIINAGTYTSSSVYVTGIVSQIDEIDTSYGNATYYISDDGSTTSQLEVYRGYYLGNAKFTSTDQLSVGDKVVIYGVLTMYYSTPEVTTGSYIVSLNGETSDSSSDGSGWTLATSITSGDYIIAANTSGSSYVVATPLSSSYTYGYLYTESATLTDGVLDASDDNAFTFTAVDGGYTIQDNLGRYYYMTGTYTSFNVSTSLPSDTEGYVWSVTFNDDGTVNITNNAMSKTLQYSSSYSSYGAYSSITNTLPCLFSKDGSTSSGGDFETSNSYITLTPSELGLDNGSECGTITLSDGTTLTFDAGSNSNAPKYYTNGTNIRMYPSNSMAISSSKSILSVAITCDVVSGTTCNAGGNVTANVGSITCENAMIYVGGVNSTSTTITNASSSTGTASQIRMTEMVIYYVE